MPQEQVQLPPEVLECVAAHLLAVKWLASVVQRPGSWATLDADQLAAKAREMGVRRYRKLTPAQLDQACRDALTDYQHIAARLKSPE